MEIKVTVWSSSLPKPRSGWTKSICTKNTHVIIWQSDRMYIQILHYMARMVQVITFSSYILRDMRLLIQISRQWMGKDVRYWPLKYNSYHRLTALHEDMMCSSRCILILLFVLWIYYVSPSSTNKGYCVTRNILWLRCGEISRFAVYPHYIM